MKRKISFGIAVLMILATCLLVSCNSEVSTAAQANDGKLVYATFDKMSKAIRPSSSSMTISYELYNIDDLYWVYTATKTDGAGTTGQTDGARVPGNDQHKGLGGAIGPFSKGTWTFTVEGYLYTGSSTETMNPTVAQLREGDDFNLIYVGTADGVVLNVTNTEKNPEPIDITVYLQTQGGTGTLKIAANSKFFWAASGEGGYGLEDLKLKVYDGETLKNTIDLYGHASAGEGHAVYYSNSEDTSIDGLASGDHVFKVQIVRTVNDVDQVFFEGTVNAKIYAGITTALDTQAIEGLFTYAQFNGTIDDSAVVVVATDTETTTVAGSVSFETNYTPASGINPSAEKTTVSIIGDDSVISAATYDLGVETSNIIAAGSKFTVEANTVAVASIDLTLKKDGVVTSTFGDSGSAKVTTYIAKNLSGVAFFYEGDTFDKVNSEDDLSTGEFYYNELDGKLVFVTSHFSEFYVTSTDEAYNANQGKAYSTFSNAITYCANGETVILLKNTTVNSSVSITGKSIEVNLGQKQINCTASTAFDVKADGSLTVDNGTINSTSSSNAFIAYGDLVLNNVILNYSGSNNGYAVQIQGNINDASDPGTFTMNGGAISSCGYGVYPVAKNTNAVSSPSVNLNGVFIEGVGSNAAINICGAEMIINNCIVEAKSYAVNVVGSATSSFAQANVSFKGNTTITSTGSNAIQAMSGSTFVFSDGIIVNAPEYYKAVVAGKSAVGNPEPGVANIGGGIYNAEVGTMAQGTVVITGGTFVNDPQRFIPGFESQQDYTNNSITVGNYTVTRSGEQGSYSYVVSSNN